MAAEKLYVAWNGVSPTTAAQVPVTTGNVIKTLLQLATPSTLRIYIVEWGICFDGSAAATPIRCELMTCTGAATVTTLAAGDCSGITDPLGPPTLLTMGTSATGFTASGEGTPAAVDMLDVQFVAPTAQYVKQWPLGREPTCQASRFVRVRVTAAAAVNAYCYVVWGE